MVKKFLSILLTLICVFSVCTIGASAMEKPPISEIDPADLVIQEANFLPAKATLEAPARRSSQIKAPSVSIGYDKLVAKWTQATASNKKKYAYYNPVIDKDDKVKYPVVIYIHGLFHGWTDGSYVKNGLAYWISSEMQDKFKEGGAHLIAPKIPEFTITSSYDDEVMCIIKDYIKAHKDNVDTSQIYIMGGSAGGGLAWKLLINNPNYFTKGVILCATGTVSKNEAKKVANIPVWEVSANTDPLVNISGQKTTWNNVTNASKVKDQCRWTRFTNHVTLPDGTRPGISHFLAKTIGYNFCTISNRKLFSGITTIDGNGKNVSLSWENSIVEWLQA